MVAETKVQFICSENINAPVLGNSFGNLITLLDDVLVNGIQLPMLNAVTHDETTMSLVFSIEHKLKLFQLVKLTGFLPDELNEIYRIIGVPDTNTIVIECNVVTATRGSVYLAPLGYEKSFSGTCKAVYRNANAEVEHRPFLRVDNSLDPVYPSSGAKYAKVGILETCTNIDDISGVQYPFDSTNPTKNWTGYTIGSDVYNGWAKWYYARAVSASGTTADANTPTAGERHWMVVGDENAFYLINTFAPAKSNFTIYGFGVYEYDYELNLRPYFLIAQYISFNISSSTDFTSYTSQGLGLHSNNPTNYPRPASIILAQNPVTNMNALGSVEPIAYASGSTNSYKNTFPVQQYSLVSSGYLVGYLPHIYYIHKSLTSADFNPSAFNEDMYVMQKFLQSGTTERINAFYLGSL